MYTNTNTNTNTNINLNKKNLYKKEKMSRKELIEYKKTLKLIKIQREVIIGTLLGDATIAKQKTKSYNIKFEQSIKNEEYINHLYLLFKLWVGSEPKIRYDKSIKPKSIWFRTFRQNSFIYYYNIFYINNEKKKVPKLIHRLLTPRVLAYWFMDDGTKTKYSYVLNTQGFDFNDQKLLLNALLKLNIKASIHKDKDKYKIYVFSESKQLFTDLIKPFILKCFFYKLHI